MKLIMNEMNEAESILQSGEISIKPSETISLLARYYSKIYNGDKKNTYKDIDTFLSQHMSDYKQDEWDDIIKKCILKTAKYPLLEIDYVPITKNELLTISQIKNRKLEKLAFTILVLAKFGNLRNNANNNWCTVEDTVLFKLARTSGSVKDQCICIHDLMKMDLITYSRRVDNLNIRVGFIDDSSDVVLKITDLRELGYQYLMYKGEKFIRCENCGVITRVTSNCRKYCKECAGYQPITTKTVKCCDCGEEFEVDAKNNQTLRCNNCYTAFRKNYKKQKERERRNKLNVDSTI